MADILRGPLVQQGKSWPNTVTQIAFPNILLGLVAAAFILPAGEQSFPLQTQHPSHALTANRDTARGTPATLTGGGAKPVFNYQHTAPDMVRRVVAQSFGTPKVLTPDASRSFKNPPQFLIERVRPVIDTSAGLNLPVSTTVVENPRTQTDWPAPIEFRYQFHNNTWDQQANPAIIPPFVPPVTVSGNTPGRVLKNLYHIRGETEAQKHTRRVAQGFFPDEKPKKPAKVAPEPSESPDVADVADVADSREIELENRLLVLLEKRQTIKRKAEIDALLLQAELKAIQQEEMDIAFVMLLMLSES